jgi:hypothetical protein
MIRPRCLEFAIADTARLCHERLTGYAALVDAFTNVFDLIVRPNEVSPAYGLEALFFLAGVAVLLLGVVFSRRRLFIIAFAVIWLTFTSIMTFQDVQHAFDVRHRLSRGEYQTLEGCLDFFHPGWFDGGRTVADDERWSVAGHQFEYGENQVRFAYHLVEPRGGAVHADTRVRVAYVTDQFLGRDDIVRLQVRQHACAAAPDRAD